MGTVTFTWRGMPTSTIGELFDAARQAWRDGTADKFMAEYRSWNEHADQNIGYLIGYVGSADERASMYAAFGVSHPLIGGRP